MHLKQCLVNLKHDVGNGGVEEDTFAAICYVTTANKARKLLANNTLSQQSMEDAREFLTVCLNSGSDTLRYIAEG